MNFIRKIHVALLITIIIFSSAGYLFAQKVFFKKVVKYQNVEFHLVGQGILEYLKFIDAYEGAFYLPKGKTIKDALTRVPRRLVLEYFYSIKAKGFAEAMTEMIIKNTTQEQYQQIKSKVIKFNSLYKSVKPGDRYAIVYIPGKGTSLLFNGKKVGNVKGQLFSYAVFSIWIGKNPISQKMRKKLLGIIK